MHAGRDDAARAPACPANVFIDSLGYRLYILSEKRVQIIESYFATTAPGGEIRAR